ncbi:MAG: hypothetical protein MZV65_17310 [Chromatiales bacterium]|nr:hypothetical protein [Chromatiales bacterium]
MPNGTDSDPHADAPAEVDVPSPKHHAPAGPSAGKPLAPASHYPRTPLHFQGDRRTPTRRACLPTSPGSAASRRGSHPEGCHERDTSGRRPLSTEASCHGQHPRPTARLPRSPRPSQDNLFYLLGRVPRTATRNDWYMARGLHRSGTGSSTAGSSTIETVA